MQLFESVHIKRREGLRSMKNTLFYNWHDLRKPIGAMKAKFTYKEFTLLAGILVALIIVLALWFRPVTADSSDVSRKLLPPVAKPTAKAVVDKALIIIQETLR
jgi:ABC-type antimicrobial peptide transport system permease subunit